METSIGTSLRTFRTLDAVIEELLPAAAASAEAFGDPPGAALLPQEAAIVARASDKRRREFTTGRECARIALGKLGVELGPILVGERGAPLWPPGIVGSITHCDGYRAAVVARTSDVTAIGLDAEPNGPLPGGVLEVVSRSAERDRLAALADLAAERPGQPGVCWDRLLFSAKESVYKAWFPLTGTWLGFEDADVTIKPDGTFTAHLVTPARPTPPAASPSPAATPLDAAPPPAGFTGRWLAAVGLVLTAIVVPAREPAVPASAPG